MGGILLRMTILIFFLHPQATPVSVPTSKTEVVKSPPPSASVQLSGAIAEPILGPSHVPEVGSETVEEAGDTEEIKGKPTPRVALVPPSGILLTRSH